MKINLTSQIIGDLRKQAQQAQEAAEKVFNEKRDVYNATLKLYAGQVWDISVEPTGNYGSPKVSISTPFVDPFVIKDNRPEGFDGFYAFKFPSRSGETDGHEVTYSWVNGILVVACNCPAGRFGRPCWAANIVKGTRGSLGFTATFDVHDEKGFNHVGKKGVFKRLYSQFSTLNHWPADFGLVKD